jgi:uncharacterized protein DUF4154
MTRHRRPSPPWWARLREGPRLVLALGAIVTALGLPPSARAGSVPSEYEVKAALLFNFAKFVAWPAESFASTDAPFAIGVVGSDPFGPSLERMLAGKTIGGRAIVIRRWRNARDRGACQLLFVSASEQDHLQEVLDGLREEPVLTVGDMPRFAAKGGIIGLTLSDNRIRFEINESRADALHLAISSRLLSLARVVAADR